MECGSPTQLLSAREQGDSNAADRVRRRLTVSRALVDRLGCEGELQGHEGCVNCLEWNPDGSVLASASDDLHVILWDPFRHKKLCRINTFHNGNIFSVKFLSPTEIATGAADSTVRVRDILSDQPKHVCTCHIHRIKRLATVPDSPSVLYSAGEDGLVLHHDLRTPHVCSERRPRVLVNLIDHAGRNAEAKCVAVNARAPHQIAVGANDMYVRLYDTRYIKLAQLSTVGIERTDWSRVQEALCSRSGQGHPARGIPRAAVTYFAPGHLSMDRTAGVSAKLATTYVSFSDDGRELLANLGSEQIYLYSVNGERRPLRLERAPEHEPASANVRRDPLPSRVLALKEMANACVNKKQYAEAVPLYDAAIAALRPPGLTSAAVLHSNRTMALLRRGWAGDAYAAVRDCLATLALDPDHLKTHFRLAKALAEMGRPEAAAQALERFEGRFPAHAGSHAVCLLKRDIERASEAPSEPAPAVEMSDDEAAWRRDVRDYEQRFLGHCNTTTDIKEASFVGAAGDWVAAGSDDGRLFLWCRRSGNLVRCLAADESILNCVQAHPYTCLLATSGIENVVRLWSPAAEDGHAIPRVATPAQSAAAAAMNQVRMRSDPYESLLFHVSEDRLHQAPPCRAS